MPTYLTPGVYIEELPSTTRPIEAAGTSTAAFVGFARQGTIGSAQFVSSWQEYVTQYGGVSDGSPDDALPQSVAAFFLNGGTRAYVVRVAAGATAATGLLVQPGAADPPQPADQLIRFTAATEGAWGNDVSLVVTADAASGLLGLDVRRDRAPAPGLPAVPVEVESFTGLSLDDADPQFIETRLASGSAVVRAALVSAADYMHGTSTSEPLAADFDPTTLNGTSMTVQVDGTDRNVAFAADQFAAGDDLADVAAAIQTLVRGSVSANAAVRDFTAAVQGTQLRLASGGASADSSVVVSSAAADDAAAPLHLGAAHGGEERTGAEALAGLLSADPADIALAGGTDGDAPGDAEPYADVFAALLKVRDINIVCLPGRSWTTGDAGALDRDIIDRAISHAETAQRRMVIVDPPADADLRTDGDVAALGLPTSAYAALYYPWVEVANPAYNAETNPGAPATVTVPPSGFAAGVWARIDGRRGVWKAPAGTEASLLGAAGLEEVVEDAEQEALNPAGVNAFRRFPGYGTVVWGSRTLGTRADPQWRYIPVRRTAMLIEESVFNGIQWAVFEPNNDQLWAALRTNVTAFMDGLFRAGAFQGTQASKAYFVACGLGSTMTQDDIDRGQVVVMIGFAPLKPAEFVIVRIQQQAGQP